MLLVEGVQALETGDPWKAGPILIKALLLDHMLTACSVFGHRTGLRLGHVGTRLPIVLRLQDLTCWRLLVLRRSTRHVNTRLGAQAQHGLGLETPNCHTINSAMIWSLLHMSQGNVCGCPT